MQRRVVAIGIAVFAVVVVVAFAVRGHHSPTRNTFTTSTTTTSPTHPEAVLHPAPPSPPPGCSTTATSGSCRVLIQVVPAEPSR